AAKDIKSGSRFILKKLGRDVTSLIKTSNDNVETKLNKKKRGINK
ncbi:28697_t:CDS:1, partial [Dentiscutata erythropus]